ncbi:transglutaminase TgpA family protein [Alkalisalibacterium limincola]|uniref:DUF3488 domain-containing protein n=1 Tax=Alkalisalibacterium limincola TaxID=2699169 RepID=A0A5C8L0W1_9GAMM|nr:DUF3488 and transglutaminase-like domain-containing protein [Alkalisalibacterium limincola]TXK65885.1 DUF3488 domain-containing protein [Alkalisalibacterium limincola]
MAEVLLPRQPRGTPLGGDARTFCLLAAALAALPLLRLMPAWLGACLVVLGAVLAWASIRRPVPAWVLVPLTLAAGALVLAAYEFRFGRDTGSALLLTMLVLKLGESSRVRDGRALIGFALFATFAAFLQDQGPLTLLLAVPAVAAMLVASARMTEDAAGMSRRRRWSRRLADTALALALALPLALAGFWLFPRLANPLWGVPENAIARPGISGEMSPGDWLDVMSDDSVAFRVRFFGDTPSRRELYWRGPVLWDFNGRTWTRSNWTAMLPLPEVEPADGRYDYELTMEPSERRFMFALDLPTSAPEGARLEGDLTPMASRPVNRLVRYRLEAVAPARFEVDLPDRIRSAATRLPDGFNPRIRQEMARWRAEGLDDIAVVERSLEWFNRDFSYTLAAPPLGRHSVDEFMYDTREGFCEHFSSAFVFMMREAGIPARVVTGYVGGYLNPMGEHWRIQQSDAHAWAEVWLPHRGWLRVDPTAAVDPTRIFERYGRGAGEGGLGLGTLGRRDGPLRGLQDLADYVRRGWNDAVLGFNAESQMLMLRRLGIDNPREWQVGALFVLGAGAALLLTLWLLLREREREDDALMAAYRRFTRRLKRAGVERAAHEAPLAFGERAATALPDSAGAIRALSRRFSDARYAETLDVASRAELARELAAFRPARPRGDRR